MKSKKGSIVLWIIIIVLVLVIAIGSYFIFSSGESISESSENIGTDGGSAGGEAIANKDEEVNPEENEDDSINQGSNEGNPSSNDLFCTDSDSGKNYDVKGETCNEIGCKTDSCTTKYSEDGEFLAIAEFYCDGNQRESEVRRCDYICVDGACTAKSIKKCTDSDEGINYNVKGKVITENIPMIGNYYELEDKCLNSERIMENYCDTAGDYGEIGVANVSIYDCPNGCQDGACI